MQHLMGRRDSLRNLTSPWLETTRSLEMTDMGGRGPVVAGGKARRRR